EAQNLAPAVLEQVRLLTNLETARQKLLQIILIGQPELRELLARNDLRQLAQRITGRYHLEPLTAEETARYIEHRLKVAGALGEVFDRSAKQEAFRLSEGVPRLINVICDRALLGAYSRESRRVDRRLVRRAAAEVRGQLPRSAWLRPLATAAGLVGAAVVAASIWWIVTQRPGDPGAANSVPDESGTAVAAVTAEPLPEPTSTRPASTAAAAVEPDEPPASLNSQLQLAADLTSTSSALAALFKIWGLEYRRGADSGCAQARAAGLACLYQRGSWSGLRQMDRPAILTLIDDAGASHSVVLTAINGDTAELSIGGISTTHPVAAITNAWFGQFMLLWRPPHGTPASLGLNSRGVDVIWLRDSLGAIDERFVSSNPASDVFDAELEELVRAFQRAHRLNVDGVAGQQTQIIINSLLAVDGTPRLSISRMARDS
ncbi:MAG: hypothetical protein HKN64_06710, partial [Woeseiaceae bacterium]|nr:hypothetical protein [Woeseiaceae bacterium]